ncbi:NAD(P)-dependent oxidoreductase [Patescibacteria group bacterium]|nr:NAD(P)-dependent oxidoreductase [Patescibacteria group bacterium]
MKNVLVTGNQGYIGMIVTDELTRRGYNVIGVDWGIFKNTQFVPVKTRPAKQIYKDIRDISLNDLREIKAVIHLAGIANDPAGDINPEATYEINCKASVRLARLAKAAGVSRFLFSSSCSVYGASEKEYVDEANALDPQTPYAKSKILAEKEIEKMGDNHFLPIFLRNATVFGISPRMRLDLVVQNLLAYGYLYNKIILLSDGTPWRPLIHIKDAARAFCFLIEQPPKAVFNQVFNIGHKDNNVQIKDIAQMAQGILSRAGLEIRNENPSDRRSYKVDFSKIYSLGFEPEFTVADGIMEIYKAFKRVKLKKEDFNSEEYITLKKYEALIRNGKLDPMNFRKL